MNDLAEKEMPLQGDIAAVEKGQVSDQSLERDWHFC